MNFVDHFKRGRTGALREIVQSQLLSTSVHEELPFDERRGNPRFAVNLSAMICFDNQRVWMPIFIRDLSENGIGFRHGVPLPEGFATISFKPANGKATTLTVELLWCRADGDSRMYISGSQFLAVADTPPPW